MRLDSKKFPTLTSILAAAPKGLALVLDNRGNPDFRQDPNNRLPGADEETVLLDVSNISKIKDLVHEYCTKHDLGGGNFAGYITRDGRPVAYVSFNGRVWDLNKEKNLEPAKLLEAK